MFQTKSIFHVLGVFNAIIMKGIDEAMSQLCLNRDRFPYQNMLCDISICDYDMMFVKVILVVKFDLPVLTYFFQLELRAVLTRLCH